MSLKKLTIPLKSKITTSPEPSASQMKNYMKKWSELQKKRLLEQPRFLELLTVSLVECDKYAREFLNIKES